MENVVNFIAFQIILKYLENVYCKLDFSTITFHNFGHADFLKHDQFHCVLHTLLVATVIQNRNQVNNPTNHNCHDNTCYKSRKLKVGL